MYHKAKTLIRTTRSRISDFKAYDRSGSSTVEKKHIHSRITIAHYEVGIFAGLQCHTKTSSIKWRTSILAGVFEPCSRPVQVLHGTLPQCCRRQADTRRGSWAGGGFKLRPHRPSLLPAHRRQSPLFLPHQRQCVDLVPTQGHRHGLRQSPGPSVLVSDLQVNADNTHTSM